jgi:hypothetical protein
VKGFLAHQAGAIICGLPSVRAVGPCVTANAGPSAPMVRSGSRRSGESAPLAKDPARYKVPDPAAAPFFPQHPVCLGFLGTASVPEHSVAPDRLLCTLGHPTAQASVPVPHPPATPNPCRAPPSPLQTELCSTWIRSGGCPYGHKCQFAHGVDELRARQVLLATRNPNHLRCTHSDLCRRTNPLHTRPRSAARSHEAADAPTVPGAALCTATSWWRSSSLCCDSWTRVRRCSCCHSRNRPRRACAVLARRA